MKQTTLTTLLLAILFTLITSDQVIAQFPRYVLLEEGTSASCPACFLLDPDFSQFLHRPEISSRVIPIRWSNDRYGADSIFRKNETMHSQRVEYYGGSIFYWRAVVNGLFPPSSDSSKYTSGAINDQVGLRDAIDAVPLTSPTQISVEMIPENHFTGIVRIAVGTEEPIIGKKLYVALVEGHHFYEKAGSYGLQHFEWIPRKMLPTNSGIPLTLLPDTIFTLNLDYVLDPELTREQMYVVAWIQDDETKEVLQAGTNHNNILAEIETTPVARGPLKDSKNWEVALEADRSGTYSVTLESDLPNGWEARALVDGSPIEPAGTIALTADELQTLTVEIDPTDSDDVRRYGSVGVEIEGERGAWIRRTLRYYADELDVILLERDGPYNSYETYFGDALRRGTHSYAVVAPRDEHLFSLTESVVVIEFGKLAPTGTDISDLKRAIDGGGTRILVSGAEVGYSLADPGNNDATYIRDEEFMGEYLHATYVRDRNPANSVRGYDGDPIGEGLNLAFTGVALDLNSPDEIRPANGAVPTFYYGNSDTAVAGIRFANENNRLVYLSFGAEGIADIDNRQLLLTRGIDWLLASDITGVNDERSDNTQLQLTAGPNPTDREVALTFGGADGPYTIDLYDMRGVSMVETMHGRATSTDQTLRMNVEGLPNGMYRLVVKVGDEVRGVPVMVVR